MSSMLLIDSFVFPVLQKVISSGKTGKVNPSWEVLALPNMMMMCTWCEPDVCDDMKTRQGKLLSPIILTLGAFKQFRFLLLKIVTIVKIGDCFIAFLQIVMIFNRGDFRLWLLPVASEHLRMWWGKETMETAFWAENMWFETFYGGRFLVFKCLIQKLQSF